MARTHWTDDRLESTFHDLGAEMRSLRSELHADMEALRNELHVDMGTLRSELHADMGALRGELQSEFADLRRQLLAGSVAIIVALIGVIGAVLLPSKRAPGSTGPALVDRRAGLEEEPGLEDARARRSTTV